MKKINFKKLIANLGIGLLGGILGAYGLTILYTVYALIKLWNCWALTIASIFFALSRGTGIPDSTDKGSQLGRFFYNLFKLYPEQKRHLYADVCTRGSIGLMCVLSVIIAPILKGNWANYFLYGMAIIGSWAFISWRPLGTVKFLGKELCWADKINYSILTFCIIKIIG